MAVNGLPIDHKTFCCSICLDLLKIPVTIPCGHSYCMGCVNAYWDREASRTYSCPQCRQTFSQRPVLVKNTMLAILMEGLKKSEAPAAPQSPSSASHGDVSCDLCSERKVKAVKSCLQCLVSFCKEHLQPHYKVIALKKHRLVQPTESLQEKMCSQHDEVMKMFCRTDQQCICYLCSVDQHKGHDTVTAAAERTEKQRQLQAKQQNLLQTIHLKEEVVDGLQEQLKISRGSADAAVEHSDKSLQELLRLLEKRLSEVKQQVRSVQEAEELRVKELQDNMQQEITELKKTLSELDTLSHTEDHVLFLHKLSSLSKVTETAHSPMISQAPPPFQDMVTAAVSKLRSKLQHISLLDPPAAVQKTKANAPKTNAAGAQATAPSQRSQRAASKAIPPSKCTPRQSDPPAAVHKANVNAPVCPPVGELLIVDRRLLLLPTTSESPHILNKPLYLPPSDAFHNTPLNLNELELRDLLPYSRTLTFDPQSVNSKLSLSSDKTVVRRMSRKQKYSAHLHRFLNASQVVSSESLTGRCFWQVLFNFKDGFGAAVTFRSICRDDSLYESRFGRNEKSWAFECYNDHFTFTYRNSTSQINVMKYEEDESDDSYFFSPIKIGIFLDYDAGTLAFFRVLDDCDFTLHLLYHKQTTFTEPLVAGVILEDISSTAQFL